MKSLLFSKLYCIIFLWLLVGLVSAEVSVARLPAKNTIKIGILAKRGSKDVVKKWQPTADYLTNEIS